MPTPDLRHLLDLHSLNQHDITYLLNQAQGFTKQLQQNKTIQPRLHNQVALNLFYEPSTRSQYSFSIAQEKLGMSVLNPAMYNLSDIKGESLLDTIQSFEAMGVNLIVIRHKDNHTPHFLAGELNNNTAIINGGDGNNEHPTQALTDLLTIQQCKSQFDNLSVAIVGDIVHSRVARSLINGLRTMGTTDIRLIGPSAFLPNNEDSFFADINSSTSLAEGIEDADVIVALRIQTERMIQDEVPSSDQYYNNYALTATSIAPAKPGAIIMHPGPINRGIEIESQLADSARAFILQQVKNSIPMRMAVIDLLLKEKKG